MKLLSISLQTFTLAGNSVRSMKGLQNHDLLQEIDLEDNQVGSTGGRTPFPGKRGGGQNHALLQEIDLQDNPGMGHRGSHVPVPSHSPVGMLPTKSPLSDTVGRTSGCSIRRSVNGQNQRLSSMYR